MSTHILLRLIAFLSRWLVCDRWLHERTKKKSIAISLFFPAYNFIRRSIWLEHERYERRAIDIGHGYNCPVGKLKLIFFNEDVSSCKWISSYVMIIFSIEKCNQSIEKKNKKWTREEKANKWSVIVLSLRTLLDRFHSIYRSNCLCVSDGGVSSAWMRWSRRVIRFSPIVWIEFMNKHEWGAICLRFVSDTIGWTLKRIFRFFFFFLSSLAPLSFCCLLIQLTIEKCIRDLMCRWVKDIVCGNKNVFIIWNDYCIYSNFSAWQKFQEERKKKAHTVCAHSTHPRLT